MALSVNLGRLRLHALYSSLDSLGGLVDAAKASANACGVKVGDYPAFDAKSGDSKDFGMNHAAMLAWALSVSASEEDAEDREALGRFLTTIAVRFEPELLVKAADPVEPVADAAPVAEEDSDYVDEPTELEGEAP